MQALCRPPTLVHTSLVLQSRQELPIVTQGPHCGYQGAAEIHGGIHGFTAALGAPAAALGPQAAPVLAPHPPALAPHPPQAPPAPPGTIAAVNANCQKTY